MMENCMSLTTATIELRCLSDKSLLMFTVFMNDIAKMAQQKYVEVISIKPLPVNDITEKYPGTKVRFFQINVRGSYDQLLDFINGIDKLPNLSIVDDFQITESYVAEIKLWLMTAVS